jgi:dsDNA-binding SOS-regulon protein
MTAIDDVETINDKLRDWIINTTPSSGSVAEVDAMKQAVDLHNQLDQLLTRLQLADLQSQSNALAAVMAKQGALLSSLSKKISATANGIQTAEKVISYAAQTVAAAAQIVAVLA